jgi:hypothetical protein
MLSRLRFHMNMDDYTHFFLTEDRKLSSTGQHCSGFLRVLYDILLRLSYDGKVPIYHCRMSMVDGLDICETSITIPLNPADLWMETIISSEIDTTVERTAHVALTSLCESRLTATTTMSIALFPIRNQENPLWKQRLEVVSDLKGHHVNAGMDAMAKYSQYLFNLQDNTARTIMQQHMRLTAYDEHNTAISHELKQLKCENALLCSVTLPPLDQDCELKDRGGPQQGERCLGLEAANICALSAKFSVFGGLLLKVHSEFLQDFKAYHRALEEG